MVEIKGPYTTFTIRTPDYSLDLVVEDQSVTELYILYPKRVEKILGFF